MCRGWWDEHGDDRDGCSAVWAALVAVRDVLVWYAVCGCVVRRYGWYVVMRRGVWYAVGYVVAGDVHCG